MEELEKILSQIQAMIVNEDPDDDDKFLREIWNLAAQGREVAQKETNHQ